MVDTRRSADSAWSGEKNANARSTDRPPKRVVTSRHTSSRASAVPSAFDKAECTCMVAVYHTGMWTCPAAARRNCPLNFVAPAFQSAGTHGAALWRGGRPGLGRGGRLGGNYFGGSRSGKGSPPSAIKTQGPTSGYRGPSLHARPPGRFV